MAGKTLFVGKIPAESPFSIYNLPFGIFSTDANPSPRPGVAIGEYVLDVQAAISQGYFASLESPPNEQTWAQIFSTQTLNSFASLGRKYHRLVRNHIQSILKPLGPISSQDATHPLLIPQSSVKMHLPMQIQDYTDFYAGRNHAYNCGVLFRGKENALQPNYEHMPIAYHGRASTITVEGEVRRPCGQVKVPGKEAPEWAACGKMDFELELGVFVAKGNKLGERVSVEEAEEYLFGVVLLNDWSARDIQAWEYVPLGPFLGKSFSSLISPWVILMDALEPLRCPPLSRWSQTPLLPYLQPHRPDSVYDLALTVEIRLYSETPQTIARTSSKNILFSFTQFIAHHTSNGCKLNTGDLLGTGTISGTERGEFGSLLENTENGKVERAGGGTWLRDGEEVIMEGVGTWEVDGEMRRIGFGECWGVVRPAAL